MTPQSHAAPNSDQTGEHPSLIAAANGDILFVSSQGYDSEEDLLVARELARRTLNDEIGSDPAYRTRVEALMARRDAKSAQFPVGSMAAGAEKPVAADATPRSKLAETLSSRANIGGPPLNRLFEVDATND